MKVSQYLKVAEMLSLELMRQSDESSEITECRVTVTTNCRAVIRSLNILDYDRACSVLLQCIVSAL
jgi:hypothetical protein